MYVELDDLFGDFARLLCFGGRYVCITGCYNDVTGGRSEAVGQIDEHYTCHVHPRSAYLAALAHNGLVPINLTAQTIPYGSCGPGPRSTGIEEKIPDRLPRGQLPLPAHRRRLHRHMTITGGSMTDREHMLVELVDEAGTALGACSVAEAHAAPGRRHRAFSVLLYDRAGRVLLQRRAAVKTRFASRWSNTCCGHPAPGEAVTTAAAGRLAAELGIGPDQTTPLAEIGVLPYHAVDLGSGQAEYEWDHILVASLTSGTPAPDEGEVSDYAWVTPQALHAQIAARTDAYTPWLPGVMSIASGRSASACPGRQ